MHVLVPQSPVFSHSVDDDLQLLERRAAELLLGEEHPIDFMETLVLRISDLHGGQSLLELGDQLVDALTVEALAPHASCLAPLLELR